MSFTKLKVDELRKIAEDFGVDVDEKAKKPVIIGALAEEGVTYDMYVALRDAERVDPEEILEILPERPVEKKEVVLNPTGKEVLVKMERKNPHFEILGKVFTTDHPFVVMNEDEAQHIMDYETGFRIASPREAAEYYS